jgi:hypothetical protein
MDTARLLDLIILVVLLILAARLVPSAWKMIRIYSGIRHRRLEDATSFAPTSPPPVTALSSRLAVLGFTRIGVRSAVLPGEQRRFEWDMVDAATTTYVAMVPTPAIPGGVYMVCYSAFGDGAFVSTSFLVGTTVSRPDLDTTGAGGTPEETVAIHYRRIAAFSSAHGVPLMNRTMADLLVRDDTYRRRHGGATMRTRVYGFVAITAGLIIAIAIEVVRVLLLDR